MEKAEGSPAKHVAGGAGQHAIMAAAEQKRSFPDLTLPFSAAILIENDSYVVEGFLLRSSVSFRNEGFINEGFISQMKASFMKVVFQNEGFICPNEGFYL